MKVAINIMSDGRDGLTLVVWDDVELLTQVSILSRRHFPIGKGRSAMQHRFVRLASANFQAVKQKYQTATVTVICQRSVLVSVLNQRAVQEVESIVCCTC